MDESALERDLSLRIFSSDRYCKLLLLDKKRQQVSSFTEEKDLGSPTSVLSLAIAKLSPDLEARVGNVEIFVDDSEISIVDSRQAKLTHFEGRALAEFGKYQLGGKPISFASHNFGESSAQETEKRIVGYIPEDRLSAIIFSLGKLAKYATFCGPWSPQFLLGTAEDSVQAQLSIHGQFSTLMLANASAGAVAVRQLPIGTETFTRAYSEEFGVSLEDADKALRTRSRLCTKGTWPPGADSPAANVGSFTALAPSLNRLVHEITSTTDYFEFERLAGKVGQMRICVVGEPITGFSTWLADLLHMEVGTSTTESLSAEVPASALNFLEGMRSGLLKLGNQLYNFTSGKFVPAETVGALASPKSKAVSSQDLLAKFKKLNAEPLSLDKLRGFAVPLIAVGASLALWFATDSLLLSPINERAIANANAYDSLLANNKSQQASRPTKSAEPLSWARDLVSVASAMPYDMKLTRIRLTPGTTSGPPSLDIEGTLPEGAENLRLVSMFMSRLSGDRQLKLRFSDVQFAGAGDSDKQVMGMPFVVRAQVAGGAVP